ncbi:SDR family oxidoreductase [Dyadobacter frigoris]|uniref:Aldehyde reductase n=1 Tax=Dyadobacter frigoris TaxID=2576211 RepID=A0A4U6CTX1_9BACT|nr:aldehyde reductase [Dyadobacter frigoris]TKT87047.1 aldehyde reductase [Dyadobacter frigoris]GLU52750.1 dihydroflavonol-4-reductase [Dyadobacter frigoris]
MAQSNENTKVLVTGGTGFVGVHCIQQLLQQGYRVHTTIRSMKRSGDVIEMLRNGGISDFGTLKFIEADLTDDTNWDNAVEGCQYVLHVASPIGLTAPKDENEMIKPALEGTLRVLKAARDGGVKRVVMTSNFGAVGYSHNDTSKVITEESWTNPNEKGLSAYNKSKVLAEKAAWDFMQQQGGNMELSVINPVGIFGPALGPELSSGFQLLKQILDGSMKRIPKMTLGIADVRDVADLHIRAMISPEAKGQRFLAISGEIMTLPQIASFFKSELGDQFTHISTKTMPNWIVRIAALFNARAKSVVPQLGRYRVASNEKAKKLLDWKPRTNQEALVATALSMVQFGQIKTE